MNDIISIKRTAEFRNFESVELCPFAVCKIEEMVIAKEQNHFSSHSSIFKISECDFIELTKKRFCSRKKFLSIDEYHLLFIDNVEHGINDES